MGTGTTRANSGIIHAGYDPEPGTRMARFNVEGNALTRQLAGELRVPFVGNGSLVVALSEEDLPVLRGLYERGQANGWPARYAGPYGRPRRELSARGRWPSPWRTRR